MTAILRNFDSFEVYSEPSTIDFSLCNLNKEGKNCTYDDVLPCRYPDKKRFSMEAVGINVDKTVRNLKIPIEWPPLNHAYRFGLVCIK